MLINTEDGCCYECEGQLELVDADDCSMTVVCRECTECFTVEPDAFGDGCVTYYIPYLTLLYWTQGRGET